MMTNHKPSEYNQLYLSVELIFRNTKEYIKNGYYDIKYFSTKRLLECCYMVFHDKKTNFNHSNLFNIDASTWDVMDYIIDLYNSNKKTYELFNYYFDKIRRSDCGFYPFYDFSTRIKYHQELKAVKTSELVYQLIVEAMEYYNNYEMYYLDYIELNYKNIPYLTNIDYNDFLDCNNYFYCLHDVLTENIEINLRYLDIKVFLKKEHPNLNSRLEYIEYTIPDDFREEFINDLMLSESDLIKNEIIY